MLLTLDQLSACTGADSARAQLFLPYINEALDAYSINTPGRAAAFLAQIGHESGNLHFTTELWGPTAAQALYERDPDAAWPPSSYTDRNWKAYELGNVQPGDGAKYRGHGLIQVTGRANHVRARDHLRLKFGIRVPDFEASPTDLAGYEWAALSAGDFWASRGLNELADNGDFLVITRRVNGGTNGLAHREALYAMAKEVLCS